MNEGEMIFSTESGVLGRKKGFIFRGTKVTHGLLES